MAKAKPSDFDWPNLDFSYHDLPYRYRVTYENGEWGEGGLTEDSNLVMSEATPSLHYGQQIFEGMKAYRRKDGGINLFRPDENAKRMNRSAERLLMPSFPVERFISAVKEVVLANKDFVPPYGSGATLYIRPLMFATDSVVGVQPGQKYIFNIYVTPVGPYFKGGLVPTAFVTSLYDRAAHGGTGQSKVGGNYAASLYPGQKAHSDGYSDVVYLDPTEHEYIEELGSANFFGITKMGQLLTPKSPSILPSITKFSVLTLAEEMGLNPAQVQISINDIDEFSEAGALGTAAAISPVGSITHNGEKHVFYSETEPGPITLKLYNRLTGIQFGDVEGPEGWVYDLGK
ncbi:branched-chain amino acid aminotransferase [Xylocopilactobacillus apicola]|uniref:Branched-chain-amino-acid aminotransferase n=1 Tax=Xylocopilactobacillus apicola TaxID=2932184 RepID=A0AAU9D9V3_9LACO|nr:branched-chain amino acid aminotransferase [Xylocopilactobacillus apicola]BDR58285.1 branched chain amino acid aminotransferase [Xylocopilactobacillus apicola]